MGIFRDISEEAAGQGGKYALACKCRAQSASFLACDPSVKHLQLARHHECRFVAGVRFMQPCRTLISPLCIVFPLHFIAFLCFALGAKTKPSIYHRTGANEMICKFEISPWLYPRCTFENGSQFCTRALLYLGCRPLFPSSSLSITSLSIITLCICSQRRPSDPSRNIQQALQAFSNLGHSQGHGFDDWNCVD